MSYASACDSGKNVQWDSDPYFHPVNLGIMRPAMIAASCGTTLTASPTQAMPVVTTPAAGTTCTLAVGQKYVLTGSAACGSDCEYNWDETNSYLQDYLNTANPRFRS
jgi:hypothetical protein